MRLLFFSLIVLTFFACSTNTTSPKRNPNIILIMTDDQGYGDMACHGNPNIITPEMDKLYKESVRLTDFHVGTTCAPTRAGLITGRNCNEVGVWHTIIGRNFLRQGETTIADILKDNGYRTGIFGKWHLGDNYPYLPQNRGFEESLIHGGGGVGQTPDFWNNDYFDDTYFRNGEPEKFEGYCTDIWFEEAIKFIESKKDESFFCYITPNAPHSPFHVPQKYIDLYKNNEEVNQPNFNGMITNIDDNLGILRDKLKQLEIAENTILIFMTDNGTSGGVSLDKNGFPKSKGYNAGMRGKKGSAYEGGHRVPFFIHWPDGNLAHGNDIDHVTSYTDVVPTLLDLCNIEYSAKLPFEGKSLNNLLQDPSSSWPSRTLITDTQRKEFLIKWKDASIMNDDFRLIRGEELYNHKNDPGQQIDIANKHPEVVKTMRAEYEKWWKRVSQRSDEVNPIPIGFDDRIVKLTCHDIHSDNDQQPAWHQRHVRLNQNPNGYWLIDVKQKGNYSIIVHRYPIESNGGFNSAVPLGEKVDGGKPYPQGIPIAVDSVKLKIDKNMKYLIPDSNDKNAAFEMFLDEGQQKLKTWIIDKDKKEVGAYYVYIQKL